VDYLPPDDVIDGVRYFLGVVNVIVVPLGLLYGSSSIGALVGGGCGGRLEPTSPCSRALTALGVWLYHVRGPLSGEDLGTSFQPTVNIG
jgi:hypothetical protein